MRTYVILAIFIIVSCGNESQALPRHRRAQTTSYGVAPATISTPAEVGAAVDALAEVNAERARRGLRAFIQDEGLTAAALAAATHRARYRIAGHLTSGMGDFAFLPAGSSARAAGCGALEPWWGWGSCCTFDNYSYAGAAVVMGADGKRYMHLFCR